MDKQAYAAAEMDIVLPDAGVDLAKGGLAGVQAMPKRQMYYNRPTGELLDTEERRFPGPVRVLLSKSRYPWEDRHLDAIAWLSPPEGQSLTGQLELLLKGADGQTLAQHVITNLSPNGIFFSIGFPPGLQGKAGALEATWRSDEQALGGTQSVFYVEVPEKVAKSGKVPLHILNNPGVALSNAPMTVGVPFPRGALDDENHVRLLDESGSELPLQTRVTARWSRFGPVKWLLCDFTADLAGKPRKLFLEYGQNVQRKAQAPLTVTVPDKGFPALDAGRIRITGEGLTFDPAGNGKYLPVLEPEALYGAFVEHENGKRFVVPKGVRHAVEELGSEKAVIRRVGWYVDEKTGEKFCNFVTRFVFHRMSPVVRIFHTWIFTGDGNKDRIRDMGWRFAAEGKIKPDGFLSSFTNGAWLPGKYLVQFDYQTYDLDGKGEKLSGRTPGVLSASVGEARVLFGAKDFWQRFPSELEFEDSSFTFYNWPRHNPPATFERPVTVSKAFLHRFAHEGKLLDFCLPDEYVEGPIWEQACSREKHWARGRPESANAQGIARTEEMFLYFTPGSVPAEESARVMQGLDEESLRAAADPQWVARSGVFGDILERDTAKYPEDEHVYELVVEAPSRWNERLGFYGKWLHGDVPAWGMDLENRTVNLYRAIRKNHHGWPVVWLPYARSADPRMLKCAEAPTRQMLDSDFCHYASEDVDAAVGTNYFRCQGWWDRSLLPWAARSGPFARNYTMDCDYIWDAYYLTGYARARDVMLLFGELTKHNHGVARGPRTTNSMMPSYLDMYQATWDPWFIAAAHEIADLHLKLFGREGTVDDLAIDTVGHFWRPADIYYHRFTGDDVYRGLALNHAISWSSPRAYPGGGLWPRLSLPLIPQAVYAYTLTGDKFHLDRAAAYLDCARFGVYDGQVDYLRGSIGQGGTGSGIFTGYYIRQFPLALGAFERAGYKPDPVPNPVWVKGTVVRGDTNSYEFVHPEVFLRKESRKACTVMLNSRERTDQPYEFEIIDPAGAVFSSGNWVPENGSKLLTVPAEAKPGVYRLRTRGRIPLAAGLTADDLSRIDRRQGWVLSPVSEPDVPEVIMGLKQPAGGASVPYACSEVQYWFMVPAGTKEFWIESRSGIAVWDPDGKRTWEGGGENTGRSVIAVPPAQAGKPWRVTGNTFTIDPQIPPYFSISRKKWFKPEK